MFAFSNYPPSLRIALTLIAGSIVYGLLLAYFSAPLIHAWLVQHGQVAAKDSAYAGFFGSLCNAGVIAALALFLARGARWARWTWLALMACGSALAVLRIPLNFAITPWLGLGNIVLYIAYGVATAYLFAPNSQLWFKEAAAAQD